MSWGLLGKIGGGIKDAAVGVGHAVGKVASNPIVDGVIGATLGPGAAAAASGLGHLIAPGGNLGEAVKGGVTGYAAGKGGQLVKGAFSNGVPSLGSAMDAAKGVAGLASASGGSIPGIGSVADLLGGNGGGGQNALAAAQALNAAMLSKKSSDFADNAMGSTQANWAERAPLRQAGQAGLLNPGQGIAPKISGIPNRNLYSKPAGPPSLGPARIG